jgi:hypothetical protein
LLQSTKDENRRQSKGAGRGVCDDEKGLTRGLEGREILTGGLAHHPLDDTKMKIPFHKAEIQKVNACFTCENHERYSVFLWGAVNIDILFTEFYPVIKRTKPEKITNAGKT